MCGACWCAGQQPAHAAAGRSCSTKPRSQLKIKPRATAMHHTRAVNLCKGPRRCCQVSSTSTCLHCPATPSRPALKMVQHSNCMQCIRPKCLEGAACMPQSLQQQRTALQEHCSVMLHSCSLTHANTCTSGQGHLLTHCCSLLTHSSLSKHSRLPSCHAPVHNTHLVSPNTNTYQGRQGSQQAAASTGAVRQGPD
jgi:hypothetical protein